MATRISFSTVFPDRMGELAGKPTRFPEKLLSGLDVEWDDWFKYGFDPIIQTMVEPKTTTIRKNYKYWKSKEGQLIQPFFWSGKPRRSKQVVFCPEVRLKRVEPIWIRYHSRGFTPNITVGSTIIILSEYVHIPEGEKFLRSEGFDNINHFCMWFNENFTGAYLEIEKQ